LTRDATMWQKEKKRGQRKARRGANQQGGGGLHHLIRGQGNWLPRRPQPSGRTAALGGGS